MQGNVILNTLGNIIMLDGELTEQPKTESITLKLRRFCAELYVRLNQVDKEYNRWLTIHYPDYELVVTQQRSRAIGIAMAVYKEVTGRELEDEDKRRILDWMRNHPFVILDQQLATEIFFRLHTNVPFCASELIEARIVCEPFNYELVMYSAV